jgi:pimeloyl-ACP methyl ester carboxylesterase
METPQILLSTGHYIRIFDSGGPKPPLVLVHGLANAIEIWARVIPKLVQSFRVIAFDLPGFGLASRPKAEYDGPFFARQLHALLGTLGIEKAYFAGNSLGASVILQLSAIAPETIARTVLAAPGGFGRKTHLLMRLPALPFIGSWLGRPTPFNNAITLRLAIHDRKNITEDLTQVVNTYACVPGSDLSFVKTLQAGVGLMGSRGVQNTAKLARDFLTPSLIIWGKNDRVFPPEQGQSAAKLIQGSELVYFDHCGHYPQWEQPDLFAAHLERFLNGESQS